jgi:hypothetical protein
VLVDVAEPDDIESTTAPAGQEPTIKGDEWAARIPAQDWTTRGAHGSAA